LLEQILQSSLEALRQGTESPLHLFVWVSNYLERLDSRIEKKNWATPINRQTTFSVSFTL